MKKSNFIEIISSIGFVSIILFSSITLYGQNKMDDESSTKISKRIETLETLVKEQQKQIESLQNEIDKIKKENNNNLILYNGLISIGIRIKESIGEINFDLNSLAIF